MKDYDFKVVATASNIVDAELMKHRLENQGIETTLSSAESSSFIMPIGNINKVKVYVAKEDFSRAVEILSSEPIPYSDEDNIEIEQQEH